MSILEITRGYSLDPNRLISYGLISKNRRGYEISTLLEKNQVGSWCDLDNFTIESCNLRMGHVTTKELNQILAVMRSGQAAFDVSFGQYVIAFALQMRLDRLNALKKEYAEHMVQFLRAEPRTQTIHGKEIEKKDYQYQSPFKKFPIEIVRLIVNFPYTIED